MVLSLILLLLRPFSAAFYAIYVLCGLSDFADGFIARKTGTASRLGEKLDSLADLVMVCVLFVILYPVLHLTAGLAACIILIFIVRALSVAIVFKKHRTFAILHSYGNKISGMLLFIFPLLLPLAPSTVLMYIICAIAGVSALEELLIHLTSKQLEVNRKSIFKI